MKKYIVYLFVCLLGVFSCDDGKEEDMSPSQVYLLNSGEQQIVFYDKGEPYVYEITICKGGFYDAAADVKVSVLTEAEVETYNAEYATTYTQIPASCYEFQKTEVAFNSAREDISRTVAVSLDPAKIKALPTIAGTYTLAVKIEQASIHVNEEKEFIFICPTVKEPAVYFKNDPVRVFEFTYGRISDTTHSMPVELDIDENPSSVSLEAFVDRDYIDVYNQANGTALVELPAEMYTIVNKTEIPEGETESEISVKLLGRMLGGGDYILPLRLSKAGSYAIDSQRDLQVMIIHVAAPLLDSSNWTIADYNTEEVPGEYDNGFAYCLIDGDLNSYWHSAYTSGYAPLPHYVVVDMQEEYTITQVDLARRPGFSDTESGDFWISDDNINFTRIGTFYMQQEDGLQYFPVTTSKGRYLKVNITESRNENKCSNLAEMMAHGY